MRPPIRAASLFRRLRAKGHRMHPNTPLISRYLDFMVLTAFSLLQFAFVFGLPWFDDGLWPQVEGPAFAIHLVSALLALVTGVQLAVKNERYMKAATSPVVISLFVFAVISALLSPFSGEPARSLQGTLKHGIGVLWHFEMALATLAATALWQHLALRRLIIGTSLLAAVLVVAAYAFPQNPLGTPLSFAEWSGMLTLAVGGATVIAGVRSEAGVGSGRALSLVGAGMLLAIAGYWVSENRAVLLCLAVVGCFVVAARLPGFKVVLAKPKLRASAVVFVAVAISVSIYMAGPLIERAVLSDGTPRIPSVLSDAKIDHVTIQDGSLGTIWSRSYLVRVQIGDLLQNPKRLLLGEGFGSFATAYEHYARAVPGRHFPSALPTSSVAYWDAHGSANFHSHNMLTETLASVGVVGAAAWLAVFALMAYSSVSAAAAALGIVVVGSFWFPLNHMIGSLALISAATVSVRPVGHKASTAVASMGSLIAVLCVSLFGYVGVSAINLAATERAERGFPGVEINRDKATCGFIRTRIFPESEVVMDLYTILQNRIDTARDRAKEIVATSTNVTTINCMLKRYAEDENNDRALIASLKGRAALVEIGPASFGALRDEIINWADDLELLLDRIPDRTELVAPYISVLSKRAPHRTIPEIDRFIPKMKDTDPVKHYLLALRAKAGGDAGSYEEHLDTALRLGLANLWPVSDAASREGK